MRFVAVVAAGLALLGNALPAPAQNGFIWSYKRTVEPAPVESRLILSYAVPETDNVQFLSECKILDGVPFASIEIGLDVSGLSEGEAVRVAFTDGGFSQVVLGAVVGTARQEGLVGAVIPLELTDPLWQAIRERSQLSYGIAGRSTSRLILTGSRQPTAEFLADCTTFARLSQTPAVAAPATPAPVIPPSAIEVGGVTLGCEVVGTLKTTVTGAEASVTFANASGASRAVLWIDGEGVPQTYASLNSGEQYVQPTFVGHPWLIADGPGNCLGIYMPSAGESTLTMNPGEAAGAGEPE